MGWRFILSTSLLLLASSAQAAAPATSASSSAGYKVGIRNFHFQPAQLVVPAGSKVTWTNHDEEPHTVTSAGGQFKNSSGLDTDDHYSVVFTKPGTYVYFCSIHPQMTGTIVVH